MLKYISLLWFVLVLLTGCIEFKEMTLYDGVEIEENIIRPSQISKVVEPEIFAESTKDTWGLENNDCQNIKITDIAHTGNTAIHAQWNRNAPGCKFAGFGIGWDGYAGKDLSEVWDYAAIQFYVRTYEGKSFDLPIVLTLEDYSGGMGFSYTSAKYFERVGIDEEWQKIVVPFTSFDIEIENLDFTNIKQLQLELQQSGNVIIDDIEIVFYTPVEEEPWLAEERLANPLAFPITLFEDEFINKDGWGMVQNECNTFEIVASTPQNSYLSLRWDDPNQRCKLMDFGVSWNQWFPVDLTTVYPDLSFSLEIKNINANEDLPDIYIGFEDYDRRKAFVKITEQYQNNRFLPDDWKSYQIPISEIDLNALDFSNIKQLYVRTAGSGTLLIDNLALINKAVEP